MMKSFIVALSLSFIAGVVAHAQNVKAPVTPVSPVMPVMPYDPVRLQSAMVAAQAASIKTGDEKLPCEALQKELVSTMNDQTLQTYAAKTNPALAQQLAQRDKTKSMSPEAAAALSAALTPNMALAMAGMSPAGQQMTAAQMQQIVAAQMEQMTVLMPVIMRSQRVTQLAMVKNCAWATGGLGLYPGLTPGALPPGAIPPGVLPPGVKLPKQ